MIDANQVRLLRERTGAGMMECKKALSECSGDFDMAVDWLRKKGADVALKKSSRLATDGLVGAYIAADGKSGVLVELNAETDFVARNEKFQAFLSSILPIALGCHGDLDRLLSSPFSPTLTVEAQLKELIATIGENIVLRRVEYLSVDRGAVAFYIHKALKTEMGGIGVLVALESESKDQNALSLIARSLAMHVAASAPQFKTISSVPEEVIAKEKSILLDLAKESGVPESALEGSVQGRIKKFFKNVVLLEQSYVRESNKTVAEYLKFESEKLGFSVEVKAFAHYVLGAQV